MATSMQDKIISGLTYPTCGLVGFIWIIITHIRRDRLSSFTRFHAFQSIFIYILLYLFGIIFNILVGFAQIMPVIGSVVENINLFLTKWPIILGYSLTKFSLIALTLYLSIFAFMGRYGEVPWISDTVRRM